jgi:hypothetical protein
MTTTAPFLQKPPARREEGRREAGNANGAEVRREPWSRAEQWILVAVCALALFVRMFRLSAFAIWVDEAHTWRDVTMPLSEFFDSARAWYPTSYLMLRALLDCGALPDESAWSLRLPFALLGVATIPLLAFYGRSLVGRVPALVAAALLAVHPWHIYWSQNARGYALVMLFAVLACGEFWRGMQMGSRRRMALGWGLSLLAASSHPSGALLWPAFLFAHVVASPRTLPIALPRKGLVGACVVAAICVFAHPLLRLLPPFQDFAEAKGSSAPSLLHLAQTTAWYFRVPVLAFAVVGAWAGLQGWTKRRTMFACAWACAPLLVLAVASLGIVKVTARYAAVSLPASLLLSGLGVVALGEAAQRLSLRVRTGRAASAFAPRALVASILALDLVAGAFLYFTAQRGDRAPWDEASRIVVADPARRPSTVHSTHEPILHYYLARDHWRGIEPSPRRPLVRSIERSDIAFAGGGDAYVRSVLDRARRDGRDATFAVVLPELREKDVDGSLLAALRGRCELAAVLPLWVGPKDESIYVFRAR